MAHIITVVVTKSNLDNKFCKVGICCQKSINKRARLNIRYLAYSTFSQWWLPHQNPFFLHAEDGAKRPHSVSAFDFISTNKEIEIIFNYFSGIKYTTLRHIKSYITLRHSITRKLLQTSLNCLWRAFYRTSKTYVNLSRPFLSFDFILNNS